MAKASEAQRRATKKHYHANKDYYKQKAIKRRSDLREKLIKLKGETPCTDCGGCFPGYVMDFDHVRGIKKFDISKRFDWSQKALAEELAKCELVCANCHRIRTHNRVRRLVD